MFRDTTTTYNAEDATWEIIIMLIITFTLGYMLKSLLTSTSIKNTPNASNNKKSVPQDDLKIIEGIGPKIEELLKKDKIQNLRDLSNANTNEIRNILSKGGDRFAMHNPSSWSDQASLACSGKLKELAKFQELLIGGRSS